MAGDRELGILGLLPGPTTTSFTVAAVLAGLAGLAAVWAAPADLGWARLAGFGAAMAIGVVAVAMVVLLPGGLGSFGIAHLAYLGIVVSLPMVGLGVGSRALASTAVSNGGALGAVVLLLPAAAGWYATHVEPHRLRVDHVDVQLDPARAGHDTIRLGVLTDLQTNAPGPYEDAAVDQLLAESPDVILLPGDLFQGDRASFDTHLDAMRTLLGRLHAPHGVYLVRGDTDVDDYADRLIEGTRIQLLDGTTTELTIGDRHVVLGGNRLGYDASPAQAVRRSLASAGADDGAIRILLTHRPDPVLDLPDSRVDLVVAGHTHGGQIAVPGFGPLVTLTQVPRHVAAGGLHDVAGNPIYVGSGVGLERGQAPQIRLFSRPTLGILTLRGGPR